MEYIIKGYTPESLFRFFEDISAIPRGSGNEAGIASYLVEFAKARGLDYYTDSLHNVVIYKKASSGYENHPPVMLQGHTDMVCEKNATTVHDFERDPLKLIIKDGMLSADGTTLGGDDGAAVAIMLAILDDNTLSHPPLECFFTVQEETGLIGALNFDYSHLSAKTIINLDSELEGEAIASCAGSMDNVFTLEGETVPQKNHPLKIQIKGLKGGHSGADIHLGRANSIRLMGRILSALYKDMPFNLVSMTGGNKRNSIPRECEAIITVLDKAQAISKILKLEEEIRKELNKDDENFKVLCGRAPKGEKMLTYKDTSKVLSFIQLIPNGVLSMSQHKAGLVESSSNLGVVRTEDSNIIFTVCSRSSVESVMDNIEITLERLASVCGFSQHKEGRYPGWAYNPDSALQKLFVEVFSNTFPDIGITPRVEAIHAGLECGIIIEKMGGDADAIAIGPTMYNIHTPDETLDLKSFERTFKMVKNLLAAL